MPKFKLQIFKIHAVFSKLEMTTKAHKMTALSPVRQNEHVQNGCLLCRYSRTGAIKMKEKQIKTNKNVFTPEEKLKV